MSCNILAIDTSTEACSVGLLFNGQISENLVISQRDHTKHILPMIDKILRQSDCSLAQLDAIAFGQGPGSFTGVRIGIGVAQGLALGINCPLIGVSNLMALAQGAYRKTAAKHVISAIDARMSEVYLGVYQYLDNGNWQAMIDECVIKPGEVANKLSHSQLINPVIAGTGWQTYPTMLDNVKDSCHYLPEAQDMVVIAEKHFKEGHITAVEEVQATYLRNEVTWKKLPGK